ncbi:MAG: hypothetical protein IJS13_07190 [Paludibacteraceae bacterium]|nr:hypothetical protein [Paludibacteraceae bacterium]
MWVNENFEDIKVGDKIYFYVGNYPPRKELLTVTSVSKAQFKTDYYTWRKSDGKMMGNDYSHARHATEKDIKEIEEANKRSKMKSAITQFCDKPANLEKLSTEDMCTIYSIIEKCKAQ